MRPHEHELLQAVASGDAAAVRRLVRDGADLRMSDAESGWPLLVVACDRGAPELILALLEGDSYPYAVAPGGPSALQRLLERGLDAVAWKLLDRGIALTLHDQQTALSALARGPLDDRALAERLLQLGARVFVRGRPTPYEVARENRKVALLEWLGGHGLPRGVVDEIRRDDVRVLRRRLNAGLDLNQPDLEWGWPPLKHAAEAGALGIVALLLGRGAQATGMEGYGVGPSVLRFAIQRGRPRVIDLLLDPAREVRPAELSLTIEALVEGTADDVALVRRLLERGATVDATRRSEVLSEARSRGHRELVAELTRVFDADAALIRAAAADDVEDARGALAQGARVEHRDAEPGWTPLRHAAAAGAASAVDVLLEHGASVWSGTRADPEDSVVEGAVRAGQVNTVRRLLSAGGAMPVDWRDRLALAVAGLAGDRHDLLQEILSHPHGSSGSGGLDLAEAILEAGRRGNSEVGRRLIGLSCRLPELAELVATGCAALVAPMIEAGARRNPQWAEHPPLHVAVGLDDPEPMVRELLRRGADVTLLDRRGATAAERARELGRADLVGLLTSPELQGGPTWHREALARGIRGYRFYYTKALGLGFDPNDVERPIRVGGDYMGYGYELTAAQGLEEWRRDFEGTDAGRETRWFLPFLEKLAAGVDFSLDELEAASDRTTVFRV
jgi:ankyrin repeat protein